MAVIFPYHGSHIPIPQESYFHTTGVIFPYHGRGVYPYDGGIWFIPLRMGDRSFVLTIRMFFTVRMEALHPQ